MTSHKNLIAYDNFEIFDDYQSEIKYRIEKLKGCDQHINFIKKIYNKNNINFLELGSGNSKLIFNLLNNNLLNIGYGIEISESRFNFAQKWKKDLMVENVININDDFLNLKNYDIKNIDVCFLVDLAFQFAEPINYKSEIKILELIYQSLKNGGKIVLELDGCNKIIQNIKTTTKIWEEFGGDDPWRYSLWECDYKKNNNFLKWKKTYISKDLSKTDFSEIVLKLYTKKTIKDLLLKVGFKKIKFYNDWFGNKFINDKSEFIVVATK